MNPILTLTGADNTTDTKTLIRLVAQHPEIEIAFLLSLSSDRYRPRYPSIEIIQNWVNIFEGRCAVHICGTKAKEALLNGKFPWIRKAGRIQVNGKVTADELNVLIEIGPPIITQYNYNDDVRIPYAGQHLSVDASGGRGILPSSYNFPLYSRYVGFAGGLTPQNMLEELTKIHTSVKGYAVRWWVDLESGLRTLCDGIDVFDEEKAFDVMNTVIKFRKERDIEKFRDRWSNV